MNAFEQIAAHFFEAQGYWTRIGLKILITKDEKCALGKPTRPRPEIDVVAFKPGPNELLIVECKSYLDSNGVSVENFVGENTKSKNRLRLFNDDEFRGLVTRKLVEKLSAEGLLLREDPAVRYGLVAGKIKAKHESRLRDIFDDNRWLFVTPIELANGLRKFADRGYEDDISTMIVKILERNVVK